MALPIYGSPMVAVCNLRTYMHRNLSPGPRLEPEGEICKAAAMYEIAVELEAEYLSVSVNLIGAFGKHGRFLDTQLQNQAALRFARNSEE